MMRYTSLCGQLQFTVIAMPRCERMSCDKIHIPLCATNQNIGQCEVINDKKKSELNKAVGLMNTQKL